MAQTGAYKLSDIDAPQHSEVHTGTVSGVKTKAEPAPAQYQGVANPPDEGQVSTGPYNLSDIDGAVNSAPPQDEEKFSTATSITLVSLSKFMSHTCEAISDRGRISP